MKVGGVNAVKAGGVEKRAPDVFIVFFFQALDEFLQIFPFGELSVRTGALRDR